MCADLMNIENVVKELTYAGVDFIHIDLIDNRFAPNLTFGPDFINQLRRITNIPFEIHYMMDSPINILKQLNEDKVSNTHVFHVTGPNQLHELEKVVRFAGDKFGIALKPDQEVALVASYIDRIDEVLLLSVHPGFFGSQFLDEAYVRAESLKALIQDKNISLCIDGSMSPERSVRMHKKGADIIVGGTKAIFNSFGTIQSNIDNLRSLF